MGHKYLFNTKHIKFNNSNIKHKIPFNYKTINKPSNNNIFSRVKFNKPRGISVCVIVFCLVSLSLSVSISFFLFPPKIRNIHQRSSRIVPLNGALLKSLNLSLKNPALLAGTIPLLFQVSNLVIHPVLTHIAGVSIVRIVVSSTCSIMTRHGIVYPAQSLTDRGIHCLWLTSISTLLLYRLLMEDSAHVGPFTKLGLRLGESLDSYSKTILVPSSTFRSVLDLGRWWRNEVRIFAADVKETRAFAVFWSQTTKAIPDINKPCSISDNSSIMALIVRYTLIS